MNNASAVERAIAALGAAQRSIVTHEQLLECGLGSEAVAYRRRAGRLTPAFRGVYSIGCGALPPLAREQAAILACGSGAFLSHRTAAAIWGQLSEMPQEPEVSVVGRYCRHNGIHVHRIKTVDPRELRSKHGLLLSSPARALLEIAATTSLGEIEQAFDEAFARRLVAPRDIREVLSRHPHSRGSARLRALLAEGEDHGLTRSKGERRFRALVRKAGLPQPEVNVQIGPYVVDFLWRAERLIVEFDGFEVHGRRRMFESDRERDARLKAAGWEVVRFTWRQLEFQPELVIFRLGQIMAAISLRARAG